MASTTTFSLEGKALKLDSKTDIEPHLAALVSNSDVEEIVLQGNTIGIEASKALAEALKTKSKLKTVNLADIYTGRLIEEIPPSLSSILTSLLPHTSLTHINLSDNAFGLRMHEPLVHFLSSHAPLQHLILNNNGLGPECGVLIANALADLAAKKTAAHPQLQTVVCGRNRLENGSMEAWAKAFAVHPGIKTVRMVQNGIRQEGIEHLLTKGLVNCKGLEILDLQDNTFTIKGAKALAAVVGQWAVIRELGVGDCLLSSRGAIALAESLVQGKNKDLKILRLQYNEIDTKGIAALKGAVKTLVKLELLELNGNKFSEADTHVEAIREIFEERGLGELDELSDLEDSDEEEDEEEEDEEEEERERVVKEADEAEGETVALEQDTRVDDLADILGKTSISK
ncbi:hypothetical protein DRE_04788 [Drechslerella stenobrocha 248]|uniref:Ran GTPase-activating protein 1 n=1 Tax=Drechslerella stenobrocha 248 TaxID=1043628 RepID=W7IAC4_9PEZI|nr:hypothetical protein DRE_04788 [Drechslerella stenobrocha 248]